ncbi:hypothetical protein [Halioxenophilus sp. WMMB6]|uniref:hypothetical protein n=1 Tax=Halioxenophilus sp. WMMB6 TaxID=3073815 RepID=UPI00295E4D46|nr:hypothetical protein [Halioxenophilus sp. WMMB6]
MVSGKYNEAYALLSPACKSELSQQALAEHYQEMVEYFSEEGPCEVTVMEPPVVTELAEDKVLVYVPILSNNDFGESEALSLVIDASGAVCDIEFGRP